MSEFALLVFLETVPMLLFGPIAGALVDRLDRKLLLVAGDVVEGLLMVSIPLLAAAPGETARGVVEAADFLEVDESAELLAQNLAILNEQEL